jgi:hypothetical protein
MYYQLHNLQGFTIPIYYGEATVQHTRQTELHKVHLIELVHGTPLSEITRAQAKHPKLLVGSSCGRSRRRPPDGLSVR